MDKDFLAIFNAIKADGANADYTKRGIDPLYSVGAGARIVVIGQAPGAVAEETRIPWNDKSGERLRDWLGVSRETFYDPERVALLPMDFLFSGTWQVGRSTAAQGIRRAVASCTLGAHAQCSAHCACGRVCRPQVPASQEFGQHYNRGARL